MAQKKIKASKKTKLEAREAIDFADRIRDMITHENVLTNHRLTWFIVIQGFLITALIGSLKLNCNNSNFLPILLISILGMLSSLSAYVSLDSAAEAINNLIGKFDAMKKKLNSPYQGAPVIGLKFEQWRFAWLRPSHFLPTLLFLGWIIVMYSPYAKQVRIFIY